MTFRIALLLSVCMLALVACQSISAPEQTVSQDTPVINALQTSEPTETPTIYSFSGQVHRGQIFEYVTDLGLIFRLLPYGQDWEIWIADSTGSDHNFSSVATPPYRGVNARQIEGWHFRNSDNSSPNEAGAKNVNAPQHERRFCFVRTETEYQVAVDWLDAQQSASPDLEAIAAEYQMITRGLGILTIRELELGNLDGERAWIEHMAFDVEIDVSGVCE